ncbi:hypothetical protein TNIN_457801 [Trichonephila inaurata madagascariensis]|uniref:Transposase IS30-like HTH domain-containing protein n=1 Tax=Trichonephila inaurata madagascariensis TaxID=2747483 RepID=A0A8X6X779_9ARAC|nr:hypothetical protein TNIN_457801 [Trichonephila inaurata madagascariensis]
MQLEVYKTLRTLMEEKNVDAFDIMFNEVLKKFLENDMTREFYKISQGKETSLELRNLIVKLKGEKKSYSEIAKIVKKPRSTVQTIYRNYVMRGNVLNKSRCGRPHKLSDRDARAIVRKVKKNPKISAPKLADQIATASGKKVHPETVRRN